MACVIALRLLLPLLLALSGIMPHCAAATAMPGHAVHHMGAPHDPQPARYAHASDACIGCIAPIRLPQVMQVAPPLPLRQHPRPLVTEVVAFTACPEPPPPRVLA